jgi:hypothetical protein
MPRSGVADHDQDDVRDDENDQRDGRPIVQRPPEVSDLDPKQRLVGERQAGNHADQHRAGAEIT